MNTTNPEREVGLGFVVPQLTIFFIFVALGVIGNTLVILTVYKRPLLQTPSYFFVSALAAEDLLTSLYSTANYPQGLIWGEMVMGGTMCVVLGFIGNWFAGAELMFMTAITVDRYLACCWPLRYPTLMTLTRCKVVITVCPLLSFALAVPPLCGCGAYGYNIYIDACQLEWSTDPIIATCTSIIVVVGMIPCSVTMVICQYKILKQVRKVTHNAPPTLSTGTHGAAASNRQPSSPVNKATITVTIVNVTYLVCWLPLVIVRFYGSSIERFKYDTVSILERVTLFVFMVSKFANPVIYGVYNQHFRGEFQKMLKR